MGKDARQGGLLPLSSLELTRVARALELCLPSDAIVKAVSWPGASDTTRNYRISAWLDSEPDVPLCSTWIAERSGDVLRLLGRPANRDELQMLYEALRELDAFEEVAGGQVAEAHYDCKHRIYQLTFTPFDQMHEGLPYRRWLFRVHDDGRPLSVGYISETRVGDGYETLRDSAALRGDPWSP